MKSKISVIYVNTVNSMKDLVHLCFSITVHKIETLKRYVHNSMLQMP